MSSPHLDLTEATILDAAIQASAHSHRRDRHTYDNNDNNRRRGPLTGHSDLPPPYTPYDDLVSAAGRMGTPAVSRPGDAESVDM